MLFQYSSGWLFLLLSPVSLSAEIIGLCHQIWLAARISEMIYWGIGYGSETAPSP